MTRSEAKERVLRALARVADDDSYWDVPGEEDDEVIADMGHLIADQLRKRAARLAYNRRRQARRRLEGRP